MTRKEKKTKERRPPIAIDPDRLTKGAMRLLTRMGNNKTLHKEFTEDERASRGVYFFMEPGGAKANREASEELIRKGRLRPLNDSLFSGLDGDSQSYEIAL